MIGVKVGYIVYILRPMPTDSGLIEHFLRKLARFHPRIEGAVILLQVQNIKFIFQVRQSALHLEIEPLSVAVGVDVRTENQIVLGGRNLNHSMQVAALESGLEHERRNGRRRGGSNR